MAIKPTRATYHLKGYSDEWIEKRMRGIVVRKKLTDEWKKRGVAGEVAPFAGAWIETQ